MATLPGPGYMDNYVKLNLIHDQASDPALGHGHGHGHDLDSWWWYGFMIRL